MVETFTRSDVCSFSCRFSFLLWRWGGGRLIFSQKLKVSYEIKIFPLTCVSCQGVRDFSGGGCPGVVTFFLEIIQFLGEGYILKLAFSHDEVLSCTLQNALNCSLK